MKKNYFNYIFLGCRDVDVGKKKLKQYIPSDASIEVYKLDLKSFTSVHKFAQQILSKHKQIHLLVNNGNW